MAFRINLYSYFVTFAKITLPIIALGLLASLFLLANGPSETVNIPYSDVELDEIINGQRLASPNYRSVLEGGAALTVNAEEAIPDPVIDGRINGKEIVARIEDQDEVRTVVISPTGYFDEDENEAVLAGGVLIRRSDGYQALTRGLTIQIEQDLVRSLGHIEIRGPGIYLDAGQAEFRQTQGVAGREVMVFSEGVKLIYGAGAASRR